VRPAARWCLRLEMYGETGRICNASAIAFVQRAREADVVFATPYICSAGSSERSVECASCVREPTVRMMPTRPERHGRPR